MPPSQDCDQLILGFYAVREDPAGGFSGGILLTNHFGRPLEFQCSLPVVPNSTQRMLYGESLKDFLIGDLILEALYQRLQVKTNWLFSSIPFEQVTSKLADVSIVTPHVDQCSSLVEIHQNEYGVIQHNGELHEKRIVDLEKLVPKSADLAEPLIRVEAALNEVLQAGKVA